jgi:DNA-binding NtrC family response regulator
VAPAGAATLYAELRDDDEEEASASLCFLEAFGRLLAPQLSSRPLKAAPPAVIVGRCPAVQQALARIERVATSDLSVHVMGETGTGKELVASALHRGSPRRDRKFVPVNAASVPDDLFESLVFGHVKGAFTGAGNDQDGYVASAEGGTLFLDEVTDLSPRAQAKLLRFLETREYQRLGDPRTRKADIRLVTAANRPLEGALRDDLIFRIRELSVALPPLRARGDDVLLLARHFLEQAARRAGRPVPLLRPEAVRALRAHAWPGNVRELQGEMRCALALCGGGEIGPEHLFVGRAATAVATSTTLRHAVRLFERDYIATTLLAHGGNRSRAARALGISRQTLLTKTTGLGV